MTFIPLEWALYGAITASLLGLTSGFSLGRRCRPCQVKKNEENRQRNDVMDDIRKHVIPLNRERK